MSSRSKRRRGERMMMVHVSNRDDGVDDSSEESVNDEEEDDDDDDPGVGVLPSASSMKMLPPNPSLSSSSLSNHYQHHRKSFPPPAKVFRTSPNTAPSPWKAPDEMIGVTVPRKARSASTKRSHDCWASSGGVGGGDQVVHRQASTSPVRSSGPGVLASASASPAPPVSPSSSNASVKKKLKPSGPKQKPPKLSSKSTSSAQDEIEIEIAEVLYGLMRQPQGPTKLETAANDSTKFESREVINNNKSTGDAKSRVSSPISNSPCSVPHSSSVPPTNSSSSAAPMSAIAPKRKRPRPVKYEDENPSSIFQVRNGAISSTAKVDADHQQAKTEASSSPNLEKNSGSAGAENAAVSYDILAANRAAQPSSDTPQAEPAVKPENNNQLPDSKPLSGEPEARDSALTKEERPSPKKESSSPAAVRLEDNRVSSTVATKVNSTVSVHKREEKFQIDLMAPPPPQLRSSPERDSEVDFVAVDPKPMVTDVEMEMKPAVKENDKAVKAGKGDAANNNNNSLEPEVKKAKVMAEEVESQKAVVNRKERNIDLQLDLEKPDRDTTTNVASSGNKLHQHQQVNKQHQQQQQQHSTEKAAQSGPLPLPMPMASWPGGLPHMGYMAPLQGVVSMDGSSVSSAAMQPLHLQFNQPRPKRCATHCYIARNILNHQQFTRMNPFWPAAVGSALQYGAKACNLNIVPPTDLHPAHPARSTNPMQDKGQALAVFPGQAGKDKSTQPANLPDNAQRKQILLQQALPPGPPSNILGPAFIFPLSQQQAAAAASVRPGTLKPPTVGSAGSSVASNSTSITAAATPVAGATAMSFNYPNMPGNEAQYLAILQNGAYPIPIPAHVGASPAYRGTPPQGMPFFNGTFYSSQMLHPSQLQQPPPPTPQSQQNQQGHQNPSISSGSSSSHKHMQNQQPRPHNGSVNGGSGNLQGFPAIKNQQSQPLQLQQRQQSQNQNVPHQARQLESELGSEDSPSTADSRVTRSNMNIYGQNFALPMHPPNFALMTSVPGATTASGNPGEKKQQSKQQGTKPGVDSLPSPAFAMSFASINGATAAPGLDLSSIAQNHTLLQGPPEAARQSYHQMMAAAQAAQKNYHGSEEGKAGGNDASNVGEERKAMGGTKASASPGQSIAFSRLDLADMSVSTIPGNMVIESSARTLNLGSTSGRTSISAMSTAISTTNSPVVQQQMQRSQQQQQQMIQLQKQQPFTAASARTKTPATSNGNVYSDHMSAPASMAAKFSNALSAFPQNLVQSSGSNSPVQSPQWKNSVRTASSQIPSQPLTPTSSALKNLPQQQGRNQLGHTQISFAANNAKPSAAPQGQPPTGTNQSPSPPVVVGSPTTSSISKSTGGSPRTTSTSTSNKGGQSSALSSQQAKNSPSGSTTQKSSPIGGRNIPPILGHPANTNASSSSNTKSQLSQQQQQQFPKHSLPQQHMLYATFVQAQAQHGVSSANATSGVSGFYLQRHRSEQQQPSQGSSGSSSAGMFSLCPTVSLSNTSTTDPAKAAAGNMKGGGLPPQSLIHAQFAAAQSSGKPHQLVPAGFTYVQAVPTVQVKPAEKKQPAGE